MTVADEVAFDRDQRADGASGREAAGVDSGARGLDGDAGEFETLGDATSHVRLFEPRLDRGGAESGGLAWFESEDGRWGELTGGAVHPLEITTEAGEERACRDADRMVAQVDDG